MGRETYICVCGQRYLTGATEWDHFRDRERSHRAGEILGTGVFLSLMCSLPGLVAYLILRLAFGLREAAFVTAAIITVLPFVLMQVSFWPGVLASMWRTRFGAVKRRPHE